jgi:hypothetical protein
MELVRGAGGDALRVWPGGHCYECRPPRHRMPFNSNNDGSECVSTTLTCQAISGGPSDGPWARVHLAAGESVRAESDAAVSMAGRCRLTV